MTDRSAIDTKTSRRPSLPTIVVGVLLAAIVAGLLPLREAKLTVTFIQGEATIQGPDGATAPAVVGDEIGPGDRLQSGTNGSATLSVPDGHEISLTGDSEVEVDRASLPFLRGPSIGLRLERGRIRLMGESTGGSLDLATSTAIAGVRGTIFVLQASGDSTLVSQHQGSIELSDAAGVRQEVGAGRGAIALADGATVLDLPASPQLSSPASGAVVDDTTLVVWAPVPAAVDYLVEFAEDEGFGRILGLIRTGGATQTLAPGLPEDIPAWVRVSAVSAEGLESAPGTARLLQLRPRLSRGQTLQEAGQIDASIAELTAALPNYPDDTRLRKDLGWSLYLAERLDESRAQYEIALRLDPTDGEALLEVARVMYWLEDYDASEAAYRQVLAQAADDADAIWGLGDVQAATGRPDEAEAAFLRALELQPDHPYAATSLARLREGR